jgi:hypothetical protein
LPSRSARLWVFVGISVARSLGPAMTFPSSCMNLQVRGLQVPGNVEPVSGFEPLTCRLQDGCSAD